MMRRVRKADVQPQLAPNRDGLEICLDCWKTWMASDDRDLSAARMRLQSGRDADTPTGYDRDVYAEQRIADMQIGEATGVMIEDMKPAYRWAIYRQCSITTQWRFDRLDWATVAIHALAELEQRLQRNIVTATLF